MHLTSDDISVRGDWFSSAMEVADKGDIPCPVVYNADGTLQSAGGFMGNPDNLMRQMREDRSEVDFTTVPFLTWELLGPIWMIPVHYCSDVWVSYRGRQLGWKTVLVKDYEIIHYNHMVKRGAGMDQNTRNMIDCKIMQEYLSKYE